MPEFCKPGLYDVLVESKFRKMKEARDRMRAARENNRDVPYWSTFPERFQKYEIEKFEKMEAQKKANLEAEKAMRRQKKPTLGRDRDFDWKGHFKAQQDSFRDELDRRKAEYRATLKECQPEAFKLSVSKGIKNVYIIP